MYETCISDVKEWSVQTFGRVALDPRERALRLVEEAVEVAQAVGVSSTMISAVVDRCYSRPAGNVHKEIGAASLSLELLAEVLDVDPDHEAETEWSRIRALDPDFLATRHASKIQLGCAYGNGENA